MSDWKYDIDEVGEEADSGPDSDDPDSTGSGPGPDGRDLEPLEPGSPTAENTLFVVLGAVTMLFLFARVLLVAGG